MNPANSRSQATASQRLSQLLGLTCLLLAIALPALVLYYFLMSPPEALAQKAGVAAGSLPFHLSFWQRAVIVLLGILPAAFTAYGLLCARRSFLSFAVGDYFTPQAVRGLRGFAGGMLFSSVAGMVVAPVLGLVVAAGAGGRSSLTLAIGSNQLMLLLFAGIVRQIAAVMAKAAALAEENARFV